MKKYLMVFANYPDERQSFFNDYMSPRNKEYCRKHNIEYIEHTDHIEPFRGNYTWLKFKLIQDMINDGFLKCGDVVTNIDADMCIVNPNIEYPCNKSFSYSIDSGNTHCMGNYSIKINNWSKELVNNILSEERYLKLNNMLSIHEAFGNLSSFWGEFREQASWYSLAGIKRHSWVPFWQLPDFGWHSEKNDFVVYSLQELYENVEVLPTEWNVTEFDGESDCRFNINKCNKGDVIIRHFAGCQKWRKEWFE